MCGLGVCIDGRLIAIETGKSMEIECIGVGLLDESGWVVTVVMAEPRVI